VSASSRLKSSRRVLGASQWSCIVRWRRASCGFLGKWWLEGLTWDSAVVRVCGERSICVRISRVVFWELRMLGQIENPPPKMARRPTRGAEEKDNSCEATRESNVICPITCGCRNSLLDILGKTRVVSHILRAQRKTPENE